MALLIFVMRMIHIQLSTAQSRYVGKTAFYLKKDLIDYALQKSSKFELFSGIFFSKFFHTSLHRCRVIMLGDITI